MQSRKVPSLSKQMTQLLAEMAHGADRARVAELLGLSPQDILDFSSNINPYGFTPAMDQALQEACRQIQHYPDPQARPLQEALAHKRNLETWQIIPGNGGADLIFRLAEVMARSLSRGENASLPAKILVTAPSFSEYGLAFRQAGFQVQNYPLRADQGFQLEAGILSALTDQTRIVALCQPNNPTGLLLAPDLLAQIRQLCRERGIYLILDECFLEFLEPDRQKLYTLKENLSPQEVIVKSLTKLFAIPGLRLGWLEVGNRALADELRAATPPWQVSGPAQAVGLAALSTPVADIQTWRESLKRERLRLSQALAQAGALVFPSQANFIFFAWDYPRLQLDLLTQFQPPILIRNCANYPGLGPGYWRLAVKTPPENDLVIAALTQLQETK